MKLSKHHLINRSRLSLERWLIHLGFFVLKLLVQLPHATSLRLGRLLGYGLYYSAARLRHITTVNIRLCFPQLHMSDQKNLIKASFAATGMGLMEAGMAWFLPNYRLYNKVELQGLHHIKQALTHGRGVILLGSHLTTIEIAGRLFAKYMPLSVVFQITKHPLLNQYINHYRQTIYQTLIPNNDIKQLFNCLAKNQIVWTAPDQAPKHQRAIQVNFFGLPTPTTTAMSKLAVLSQAPIIPVTYYRKPDDAGYRLTVHPPLEHFGNDPSHDALRLNQWLETVIHHSPEQYLWQYKRFKPITNDQVNYYDQSNNEIP